MNVEELQGKFGLSFAEAVRLSRKIKKLGYTNPKAKLEIGYIEAGNNTKLVLTLDFNKYSKG